MKSIFRNHRCQWQTWVREGLEANPVDPVQRVNELVERVRSEKPAKPVLPPRRPAPTIDFKRRASGDSDD
ncbi:hypothetical protein [Burkholderia pyrrocinia]|uniref:hypothetical protein n=1 Tax=Burkholderia pyrrocinia TaxID=60550 RepID=UPI002AAFF2AA|nr:hypothetical protein [Burkholderia pyrrocinia]